jgi:hypothetical protein
MLQCLRSGLETVKLHSFAYLAEFSVFCHNLWRVYRLSISAIVKGKGKGKGKGKTVPLQACSGPEGSRNLRFPDFMTTAQDGGKVVSLTHRPPLPSGNTPGTHFC